MYEDTQLKAITARLRKTMLNMGADERAIFLEVYEELESKILDTAKKKTAIRLARQRAENVKAARERLPQVMAEISAAQERINQWFTTHAGDIMPVELRNKKDTLFREREKLESLIRQG